MVSIKIMMVWIIKRNCWKNQTFCLGQLAPDEWSINSNKEWLANQSQENQDAIHLVLTYEIPLTEHTRSSELLFSVLYCLHTSESTVQPLEILFCLRQVEKQLLMIFSESHVFPSSLDIAALKYNYLGALDLKEDSLSFFIEQLHCNNFWTLDSSFRFIFLLHLVFNCQSICNTFCVTLKNKHLTSNLINLINNKKYWFFRIFVRVAFISII